MLSIFLFYRFFVEVNIFDILLLFFNLLIKCFNCVFCLLFKVSKVCGIIVNLVCVNE